MSDESNDKQRVGQLSRVVGIIPKVKCRVCCIERFDDGTPCPNPKCGVYQNPDIGRTKRKDGLLLSW